jgi:cytochrome b561
MKIISNIAGVVSIILILLMLLCGLWLKSHPTTDPESVKFHIKFGLSTLIISLISIILLMINSKGIL